MSGECSFFRFCLRGNDSLASKWISQKRKIGKLREDGANIYSISDYIHHVFCFEKLYGTEYTSNMLFNRIIEANHLDKNDIVKFDEEIVIPFNFSPRKYKKPSFDELAKEVKNEPVADFKLGDSLDENEIKEMLINTYHINYDIRSNENIADKTYDEIIREGFLDFKDDAELSFFLPYIFEIPTKKVVESSVETPVEISLTESAVQPEVVETAVEGYFYTMNGEYAGKYGNSEDCYVLNKGIDVSKNLDESEYKISQVLKLSLKYEDFRKQSATIYGESTAYKYGKSDKSANDEIFALAEVFKVNKKAYGATSKLAKEFLKKTDKENNSWESRKAAYAAIIYTDVNANPNKYSNGATHWDGKEQAIYITDKRGVTDEKFKEIEGEFTDDSSKSKFELHMNTWGWYIKDNHYKEWKKNIGTSFQAPQKKKATYGINKDKICALSTVVYNQTIFWKVKNGGYEDDELE